MLDLEQFKDFTPGPWIIFTTDNAFDIMPAMRPGDIARDIKNENDAELIRAAPDLLAECRRLRAENKAFKDDVYNVIDNIILQERSDD